METTTELALTTEETQLNALKAISNSIAAKCKGIEVKDETSNAIALQIVSEANQLVKGIETKRSELKAPYLDAGRKIDSIAKEISAPLESAVAFGKGKIKEYAIAVEKEKQKKLQRIANIKVDIQGYYESTITKIKHCKTIGELILINEEYIKKFPGEERWFEFVEDASSIRKLLHDAAKARKEQLSSPENNLDGAEKIETANFEVKQVLENTGNEEIAELELTSKTPMRTDWKFEVIDIKQVPVEFLLVDAVKVRAWQKQMRENDALVDGSIHYGIKHYTEQTVVSR